MGVRLGPGWQSPAAMPRRWLAGLFAVSAIFASLVAIFSSDQVHQLWGAMAACGYGLAVAAVLGWRKRGVDLALGLSFCGALVLPLGWMAAKALEQPEVAVVARSAWTLIHQGSPYAGAASLATTHNPNAYNPYLPVMTLFGLPRAFFGGGRSPTRGSGSAWCSSSCSGWRCATAARGTRAAGRSWSRRAR